MADHRTVIDGMFWVHANGASWRDLPEKEFGPWQTIYGRYNRWRKEAADRLLFAPPGGLRDPDSELIPIFQTVSRGSFANYKPGHHRGENSSRCPRQSAQHEPAHRPVDHRLRSLGQPFVILAEPPR